MITIDGAVKSGSGTIVRYSLSLASLLKRDIRVINIRAKRRKKGLAPQHLKTVQASCQITGGKAENAYLGSSELIFKPGSKIRGGTFDWDIGTAGSTTMMALCILPIGCFADKESIYTLRGGLFQDFAPNPFHMKYVLMNLLRLFSIESDIEIVKPGYVPTGGGIVKILVKPVKGKSKSIKLLEQGKVKEIKGVAISSHLKMRNVSHRMRDIFNKIMTGAGYKTDIETIYDNSANQRGAGLFVRAITDTGCILGADMAGKPGRTSEEIGKRVARKLLDDIRSKATVDRYTADQLILYSALAEGESEYIIPQMTEHIDSNLWLAEKILGAKILLRDKLLKIKGIGFEMRAG